MVTLAVMLDLETWSTKPNATIISIGAVKFDPFSMLNGIDDRFHVGIDPSLTNTKLLDLSPQTIQWWISPDQATARGAWLALAKVDLATALDGFSQWFGNDPTVPVWGNASTFDNVILRYSYELLGMECPWGFRSDRCYRTVKNLAPNCPVPEHTGVAHDALVDAEWQARHLQSLFGYLGIGGAR